MGFDGSLMVQGLNLPFFEKSVFLFSVFQGFSRVSMFLKCFVPCDDFCSRSDLLSVLL